MLHCGEQHNPKPTHVAPNCFLTSVKERRDRLLGFFFSLVVLCQGQASEREGQSGWVQERNEVLESNSALLPAFYKRELLELTCKESQAKN